MKNLALLVIGIVFLTACKEVPKTGNFGETITAEGAVPVAEFVADLGEDDEKTGKIIGKVQEVCKTEGCWYTVALPEGESMMVMTKDHSFTLPKDCDGKTAIAQGRVYWKTTSVEDLKHYAVDAKKPQAEIDAITEPKRELRFEASGVIIQ
jgi:hypothetical protein